MYNYINYLNILLIIILVVLLVYIGFEIYYSNQTPKKYEAPAFDKAGDLNLEQPKVILDHEIKFKNEEPYSGIVSFTFKTTDPSKTFNIDWGNGLQIPYSGSSFVQKLPPVLYKNGLYTITIYCEENTFESLECVSIPPNVFK
jgi:hypothetical protein